MIKNIIIKVGIFSICIALIISSYIYNNNSVSALEKKQPINLSIEQGNELIEKTNGKTDKTLKYIKTNEINGKKLFFYENDSYVYAVNSMTGNISSVVNKDIEDVSKNNLGAENAKIKAIEIIKKFIPNVKIGNMKLVKNEKFNGISFEESNLIWKEYNENGIFTGNSISVILNGDGELSNLSFYESSSDLANVTEKISQEQAVSIAFESVREYLKNIQKENVLKTKSDYNIMTEKMVYNDKLVRKIEIKGVQDYTFTDATIDFIVHIDCISGEVVEFNRTL